MATDSYDLLMDSCNNYDEYPQNLIRSNIFRYSLESYHKRLLEQRGRLFDPNSKHAAIDLLDAYDGDDVFRPSCHRTVEDLKLHLQANRKDPRCRYAFIQAESSRAPLDCSAEMFTHLLTFHQVMAAFLDLVFSFGKKSSPIHFHYTAFRQERFLQSHSSNGAAIPKLGRSGREIRLCYNLWSVELSDAGPPWSIRQTAVYHSFDIENGRTLWITIKANGLMHKRIVETTTSHEDLQAGSLHDVGRLLAAALVTHLIFIEWCDENWRWYISKIEDDLHKILIKIRAAPIEMVEKALALDAEKIIRSFSPTIAPHAPSRATTFSRKDMFSRRGTITSEGPVKESPFKDSPARALSSHMFQTDACPSSPGPPMSPELDLIPENHGTDGSLTANNLIILDDFSIEELQRLHQIGSKLQEASIVMKLNLDILADLRDYYDDLNKTGPLAEQVKVDCEGAFSDFAMRVKTVSKDLEMERVRIESLILLSNDSKTLFEGILQYRNSEYNKLFTVSAQESASRVEVMTTDMHASSQRMEDMTVSMHKIAKMTERETASMHIITLVTLVFLPGTFVATFLNSGLYQWEQGSTADMPTWKPELFILFSKICFPMMAVTILIWLAASWWASRRSKSVLDAGQQCQSEKGDA